MVPKPNSSVAFQKGHSKDNMKDWRVKMAKHIGRLLLLSLFRLSVISLTSIVIAESSPEMYYGLRIHRPVPYSGQPEYTTEDFRTM